MRIVRECDVWLSSVFTSLRRTDTGGILIRGKRREFLLEEAYIAAVWVDSFVCDRASSVTNTTARYSGHHLATSSLDASLYYAVCSSTINTTARYPGHYLATSSPTDSLVAHGRLVHPSHALVDTPQAVHEARATASWLVYAG